MSFLEGVQPCSDGRRIFKIKFRKKKCLIRILFCFFKVEIDIHTNKTLVPVTIKVRNVIFSNPLGPVNSCYFNPMNRLRKKKIPDRIFE